MINLSSPSCARLAVLLSILLVLISAVFGFKYFETKAELATANTTIKNNKFKTDVARFGQLFVGEVLKADREVDFETRLKLENEVRNLKDEVILKQWSLFIKSKTEVEAQSKVKDLLSVIMARISPDK